MAMTFSWFYDKYLIAKNIACEYLLFTSNIKCKDTDKCIASEERAAEMLIL